MNQSDELLKELEAAAETLQEAAAVLQVKLPKLRRVFERTSAALDELREAQEKVSSLETTLSKFSSALAELEGCVLESLEQAQAFLHDHSIAITERERLLELVRRMLRPLERAGFTVVIPSIGERVDDQVHTVKGRSRSALGAEQVADIVSWGYSFPSGSSKKAEVLVGDASVVEQATDTVTERSEPTPKEGIAMVLDTSGGTKKAKPPGVASHKGTSLFEKLEEAAKRNRGDGPEQAD